MIIYQRAQKKLLKKGTKKNNYMAKIEINKTHINKLKQQRRTVGLLQFKNRDDQNFSKWYSLTQNLVIKAFGQKSNQLIQLNDIYGDMHRTNDNDYYFDKRIEVKDAKEKFKDLITVFVSELELDFEEEPKAKSRKSGNISVKMENTQTINQTIDISIQIKSIIENIKQNEPDSKKAQEAEQKLKELETEVKSGSPAWSKIKDVLVWLLNFSRDAFLQVLPIILQAYKK